MMNHELYAHIQFRYFFSLLELLFLMSRQVFVFVSQLNEVNVWTYQHLYPIASNRNVIAIAATSHHQHVAIIAHTHTSRR